MTMPASTRIRVAVLLTSIVVALVLLLAGAVVAEADDAAISAVPSAQVDYTVRSGDTLWDIACVYVAPGDDVRVLIERVASQSGDLGLRARPPPLRSSVSPGCSPFL